MEVFVAILAVLLSIVGAKVVITSPKELRDKIGNDGLIPHGIANFGVVPYGHSIFGNIFYGKLFTKPIQSLNLNNLDDSNAYGCEEYKHSMSEMIKYDHLVFYIVRRGSCSAAEKVLNIQKAGGKLAMIVDVDENQEPSGIILASNLQAKVNIPTVILDHGQGEKLIEHYLQKSESERKHIYITVQFETNKKDDRVEYEIWLSSVNDKGMKFVEQFYKLHRHFGDHVLFQPRYFTWSCTKCSEDIKAKDCFGDGKY